MPGRQALIERMLNGITPYTKEISMHFPSRYERVSHNMLAPKGAEPFTYSDGDQVEQHLAKVVAEASDCSLMSPELNGAAAKSWASLYHLSPRRSYLVRPLEHLLRGSSVLELGAGCGALTRYFGETAKTVVALEGSDRRAGIAASRCRDLENVTVVNDTIQELELEEKFDVVTLIGVLEYARTFGPKSDKPELDILRIALSFLKPGGRFLLAIENQLGLKYFAGAAEDHIALPFFGIHDLYTARTPVTFGRKELLSLLREAGFRTMEQLVPLPDYKLPITVLYPACVEQDDSPVDPAPFIRNSFRMDFQPASDQCFSLEAATAAVVRNGLMKDLCNSFFFVASPEENHPACDSGWYVAHYGSERAPKYLKETLFFEENGSPRVTRRYINNVSRDSNQIAHTIEDEPYFPYPVYLDLLCSRINMPGWNVASLVNWAKPWIELLRHNAEEGQLPGRFLDAIPANLLVGPNDEIIPFDCEWSPARGKTVSLAYVVFRGLFSSLTWFENVAPPEKQTSLKVVALVAKVMVRLGVDLAPGDIEAFIRMENQFQVEAARVRGREKDFLERTLRVRSLA